MRTTLDIDDDLLAAARQSAQASGRSIGRVVSDLLRAAMTGQASQVGVQESAARYGFVPFPAKGTVVSNEDVDRLRDQEGV